MCRAAVWLRGCRLHSPGGVLTDMARVVTWWCWLSCQGNAAWERWEVRRPQMIWLASCMHIPHACVVIGRERLDRGRVVTTMELIASRVASGVCACGAQANEEKAARAQERLARQQAAQQARRARVEEQVAARQRGGEGRAARQAVQVGAHDDGQWTTTTTAMTAMITTTTMITTTMRMGMMRMMMISPLW
jgi:hypothetical protein